MDANRQVQCAIWGEPKNPNQAHSVWQSESRSSCEAKDCSQLFSKFCQKIQMWPYPDLSLAEDSPIQDCYCDQLLFENEKGQVQLLCAAWFESSKNVIEYYSLEECNPTRCLAAPFHRAAVYCSKRFKNFYPALLRHG